jgi:hypothetical protein
MVAKRPDLSYPAITVKELMAAVEKPIKVFDVLQESNVDGEIHINVTPCASLKIAQAVMNKEVETLLSEKTSKYYGLDLDEIEKAQKDDNADCDYYLDRNDTSFYLEITCDDYYEHIDIIEKEMVK